MKKIAALLLFFALILCCAQAESSLPAVGDKIAGFTVAGIYPFQTNGCDVVEFTHDKTGAPLIWIASDSLDRAFVVGFRTQVYDDKGIPHVFEHAALSGSEKYPNPNLFMALADGTYNTYMNGMTARTYTYYPVSSLSEEQLLRYVDFYMDGVYNPLVLTDERSMLREAVRYELPDADSPITIQGTVYSEMLGAITQSREAMLLSTRNAYPGSSVGYETGGVPGVIETMTHEDIVEFHNKFYHPSNSIMVLCGDLNIADFLELIDGEYLSKYDRVELDLSEPDFTPLAEDVKESVIFPTTADAAAETMLVYTIPLTGMTAEETEVFSVAFSALASQNQTFDLLFKERLPGLSFQYGMSTGGPSPRALFVVLGAQPEQADEVTAVIREGIAATIEAGLDPELLSSYVLQMRFSQAQSADNTSSVDTAMNVVSYWGDSGDPLAFLVGDTVSNSLNDYLEAGAFDEVLAKYLPEDAPLSLIVSTSEPGLKEQEAEELEKSLAEMKAAMSEEEITALVQQTQDLQAWNAENEQSVTVADLAAVDAATLPEEVVVATATDENIDGMRVVTSVVDSDMMDIHIRLDASCIEPEKLDAAIVVAAFVGMLPTENYDPTTLSVRTSNVTTGIYTSLSVIEQEDFSYEPYFDIEFSCFPEGLDEAFSLVEEIMMRTDFEQMDYLQMICSYYAPLYKQSIAPDSYALSLAYSAFSEGDAYTLKTGDVGMYKAFERVGAMDEEELSAFHDDILDVMDTLLNKNGMILTVVGNEDNIAAATDKVLALRELFSDEVNEPADYSAFLAPAGKSLAATYGADAMYNAIAVPFKETGLEFSGDLNVFNSVASSLVLIPVMRNTYSVYTPMISAGRNWVVLLAYRDPRLAETYNEVIPSLSEYFKNLSLTQEELNNYITSAYSGFAAPVGPFSNANTAISNKLYNRDSYERTLAAMRAIKATTVEKLLDYAQIFDTLAEQGAKGVVGNAALINENSDMFDAIDTSLTD